MKDITVHTSSNRKGKGEGMEMGNAWEGEIVENNGKEKQKEEG